MVTSRWGPKPFTLLTDMPIILLNLNLIETVHSQYISSVELGVLIQKR
jgi:hypothetical protein